MFLDNDTNLLFATAYDDEWGSYIENLSAKIPDALDMLWCNIEAFPGFAAHR